jgi:hypothetical protein
MKNKIILFIILISSTAFCDDSSDNTITNNYITNIYNTYQNSADYLGDDNYNILLRANYLQLLENSQNQQKLCTWVWVQVKLKDGRTIPFYQCK